MLWMIAVMVIAIGFFTFEARKKRLIASTGLRSSVWNGATGAGIPVARYGDGNVWKGSTDLDAPVGRYRDGNIWNGQADLGAPVGRYRDGNIWSGQTDLGMPVGRYHDGNIWSGPTDVGTPIAHYDGEGDGAAAAFVLELVGNAKDQLFTAPG